jgi:hypothetical protein
MTLSLMSARQTDAEKNFQLRKRRAREGAALSGFGVAAAARIFCLVLFLGLLYAPAARAITVGPAKLEYRTDPGAKIEGKIVIFNEGAEDASFYAAFEKFTEVNGEKKFLRGEPAELANWFKMEKSVTLKAGESKEVPFTIEVPENAPPGGHFAVIWWGTAPPGANQVSIVTRAGILVYLNVSGEVKETGEILSFYSAAGRIAPRLPDFKLRFKNSGNTYLKPQGKVVVKNIFGATVAVFKVNDIGRILLPATEEDLRLSPQFERRPFALGFYRAALSLSWGEKPETGEREYYVLVLPPVPIIVGLAILVLAYFGLRIGIRKYNERIIAKYTASKRQDE